MSHELRKATITALSLVLIGGLFNSFESNQRIHVSRPQPTNAWQVYTVPAEGAPAQESFSLTRSSTSFNSLTKAAVVLVNFDDRKISTPASDWQKLVFGHEADSVYGYYHTVSQGQLALVPTAETSGQSDDGVISVALDSPHPNNQNELTPETYRAVYESIQSAAEALDLKAIDANGNYVIEPEELIWMVVFAGYEELYKKPDGLASSGFSHDVSQFGPVSGYVMTEFIQIGELYYDSYRSKTSLITTPGILIHEMGHVLGLPDLYDTDYSSQGVGLFSLMGNGDKLFSPNGRLGDAPVDLDPWSKVYLGFADPQVVTEPGNYLINDNTWGAPEVLIVPTGVTGEYFVVENRHLKNRDQGLALFADTGGVLIWHVDERLIFSRFFENVVNNDEAHKGLDLEEASETSLGYSQLDGLQRDKSYAPFYTAEGVSLFDDSSLPSSRLNGGSPSGISIQVLEDGFSAKVKIDFQK